MRSKFQRFFAFLMTALFVFEAVPAIAYAEAGEAIGRAADSAIGELLEEQEELRESEPAAQKGDAPADKGSTAQSGEQQSASEAAPIASVDEPTAISETTASEENMQGLVTEMPDGWSVKYTTGMKPDGASSATTWSLLADKKYKENPVWKTDASPSGGVQSSTLQIQAYDETDSPATNYFIVYDYACVGASATGELKHLTASTLTQADGIVGAQVASNVPSKKAVKKDDAFASSFRWDTAVVGLGSENPVLYLNHTMPAGESSDIAGGYLANVRIYKYNGKNDFMQGTGVTKGDLYVYVCDESGWPTENGSIAVTCEYAPGFADEKSDFDSTTLGDGITVPRFSKITLTFVPKNSRVHFDRWEEDGDEIGSQSSYTFVLKNSDEITAFCTETKIMDGLVTELPDGWSVESSTGTGKTDGTAAAWGLVGDVTHEGNAVWKSLGEKRSDGKVENSTLFIAPKTKSGNYPSSCYVVYDYLCAGSGSNSQIRHYSSNKVPAANSYVSSYSTKVPNEPEVSYADAAAVTASKQWKTGVVRLSSSSPALYLLHELLPRESASYFGGFVSNVRIYEDESSIGRDLSQQFTLHYTPAHGSVKLTLDYGSSSKVYEFPAGQDAHATSDELLFPIFCDATVEFTPVDEGIEFDGWYEGCGYCESESSEPIGSEVSKATTFKREIREGGESHDFEAVTKKLAVLPSISLSRRQGSDGDWQAVSTTDTQVGFVGNDWYRWETWTWGVNSDQAWRIDLNDAAMTYSSITATDNDGPIGLSQDGTGHYLEITPADETHHIVFTFSQDGVGERKAHVILWPTLDWDDAFGTAPEGGGEKIIDGLDTSNHWNTSYNHLPDRLLGCADGSYTSWLYEPHPDAFFLDGEHELCFTSSDVSDSTHTYMEFNASRTGLFSLDYAIMLEDDDAAADYEFYVANGSTTKKVVNIEGKRQAGRISWQHVEFPVTVSGTYPTHIYVDFRNKSASNVAIAAVSNLKFNTSMVSANLTPVGIEGGSGSIKVNDGEPAGNYYLGGKLTFTPEPAANSVFVGWYDSKGNLLCANDEYELTITGDVDVHAHFIGISDGGVAYANGQSYATLGDALEAAALKGGTVLLLKSGYELGGDVEVPAGVTLVIPSSATDFGYKVGSEYPPQGTDKSTSTGAKAETYKSLIIPSGRTLTVRGAMIVNAVVGRPAQGHYDQDVNGGCGEVQIQGGGSIVVEAKATLESPGYIKGEGSVVAKPGATVADLFVVRDWRGGTQASRVYSDLYPMNEYDCHNIQCPITIESGATYTGIVRMYASGDYHQTRFPQVDNINGLIRLTGAGSSLEKTYDAGTGHETYSISGGATFDSSRLEILKGMLTLTTRTYVYPWNGVYDFVLANGDYTFDESFKFMPGSSITANDANLFVQGGETVVLYDTFDDSAFQSHGTAYPSGREAATLTLNGSSTLVNRGNFAGTIEVGEAWTGSITGAAGATWKATTLEGSGMSASPTSRQLTFAMVDGGTGKLGIDRGEGFSWRFSDDQRSIVWTGASDAAIQAQIERYEQLEGGDETVGWTEGRITAVTDAIDAAEAALPQPNTPAGQAEITRLAKAIEDAIDAAQADLRQITVTFDAGEGAFATPVSGPDQLQEDGTITRTVIWGEKLGAPPQATRPGWKVDGWTAGDAAYSADTPVKPGRGTDAIELSAQWGVGTATPSPTISPVAHGPRMRQISTRKTGTSPTTPKPRHSKCPLPRRRATRSGAGASTAPWLRRARSRFPSRGGSRRSA